MHSLHLVTTSPRLKHGGPLARARLRLAGCILLVAAAAGLTVPAHAGRTVALPCPSGPHAVGVVDLPLQDPGRPGDYSDGTTTPAREIMVRVWYPAVLRRPQPTKPYLDEVSATYLSSIVSDLPPAASGRATTHAIARAPFARGRQPHPVVLFSPGLEGMVAIYQCFLEDLASHGYVVFGVDSPDVSGITVFPDGHYHLQVLPDQPDDDDTYDEHAAALAAADLSYVATQLSHLNRDTRLPFAGRLDLHAIAAVGHSIGGAASVEACLHNPLLRGAINLDGTLRGTRYKQPICQPMLMVTAGDHPDDPSVKLFRANLRRHSAAVRLAGTGHWSFTDLGVLLAANGVDPNTADSPYGTIDPARAVQLTRLVVRAFLDNTLRDDCGAFSRQRFRPYPEISFETVGR